jgi:hypothetical protein
MNSSAPGLVEPGLGKSVVGMDLLALLDVAGGAGRHVEHDTTGKIDFNPLSAIGTKLSHLIENRQRVRFARLASNTTSPNTTSPFSAIYVKVASNVDRGLSRRDEIGFERRSARVLGPFQGEMSDRVAEGGLKTPEKSAMRSDGVERMTVSRSDFPVELTAQQSRTLHVTPIKSTTREVLLA